MRSLATSSVAGSMPRSRVSMTSRNEAMARSTAAVVSALGSSPLLRLLRASYSRAEPSVLVVELPGAAIARPRWPRERLLPGLPSWREISGRTARWSNWLSNSLAEKRLYAGQRLAAGRVSGSRPRGPSPASPACGRYLDGMTRLRDWAAWRIERARLIRDTEGAGLKLY